MRQKTNYRPGKILSIGEVKNLKVGDLIWVIYRDNSGGGIIRENFQQEIEGVEKDRIVTQSGDIELGFTNIKNEDLYEKIDQSGAGTLTIREALPNALREQL